MKKSRGLSREVRLRASLYIIAIAFTVLALYSTKDANAIWPLAAAAGILTFVNHFFELEDGTAFRVILTLLEALFFGFVSYFSGNGAVAMLIASMAVGLSSIQYGQTVGTYYALFLSAVQLLLAFSGGRPAPSDLPLLFLRLSLPLWTSYLGGFAYAGGGLDTLESTASGAQKQSMQKLQTQAITETRTRLEREQELFDERRRLEALLEVSQRMASVHSPEELLATIVDCSRDQVKASVVVLMLRKDDDLICACKEGITDIGARFLNCKVGQGVLGRALASGENFRFTSHDNYAALRSLKDIGPITQLLAGHTQRATQIPKSDEIRNMIAVPLKTPQDRVPLGLLILANRTLGEEFTDGDASYLQILAISAAISIRNLTSLRELERSHDEMIQALAQAIEAKDAYTHGHVDRVRQYSVKLARGMGLPIEFVRDVRTAAILHDVGKISTPDRVLLKPGPLTDEEFEIMKQHAAHSVRILRDIRSVSPDIQKMVLHHHERWDGKGYPAGLKGSESPLGAQIIAVADCYDAMTSDRPYRKGFPAAEALHKMAQGAGTQFNTEILAYFLALFNFVPKGLEPIASLTTQAIQKVGVNLMKIPDPDEERRTLQISRDIAGGPTRQQASLESGQPKRMLELET